MSQNNNVHELTKGNLRTQFFKYLAPSMISALSSNLFVFFDMLFVGRGVGAKGLAAMSIALPMFTIFASIGLLLSAGGATTAAVELGAGNKREAGEIFSLSLNLGVVFCILLTTFGLLFLDNICRLLGASPDIFDAVRDYVGVLLCATPGFVMNMVFAAYIRNDGSPRFAMGISLFGNAVNIILDYLFVFPFGWGIWGAALATAISTMLNFAVSLGYFIFNKKTAYKYTLAPKQLRHLIRLIRVGIPSCSIELCSTFMILSFNMMLLRVGGSQAVSAYSVVGNINYFGFTMFTAAAYAAQPMISTSFGAGNMNRVSKAVGMTYCYALLIGAVFQALLLIFTSLIFSLFAGADQSIVDIGVPALRIFSAATLFATVNAVTMICLQSIEKAGASTVISVSRSFVAVTFWIFLLGNLFGLNGVWAAMPAGEITTFVITAFFIFKYFRGAFSKKDKVESTK